MRAPGFGCGLAILRGRSILLYRRVRPPEAGHWNIVGGKVDLMEHSMDAARREALEETGLALGNVRFLCVSEQIFADEVQHWISMIYLADEFLGEPVITEPDKLDTLGWFDIDDLPQPISRFTLDAVDAIKRLA